MDRLISAVLLRQPQTKFYHHNSTQMKNPFRRGKPFGQMAGFSNIYMRAAVLVAHTTNKLLHRDAANRNWLCQPFLNTQSILVGVIFSQPGGNRNPGHRRTANASGIIFPCRRTVSHNNNRNCTAATR